MHPFFYVVLTLPFHSSSYPFVPIFSQFRNSRRPLFLFLSLPALHYEIITDKKLGNANKLTRQSGMYAKTLKKYYEYVLIEKTSQTLTA
jgi:hypothetical protein